MVQVDIRFPYQNLLFKIPVLHLQNHQTVLPSKLKHSG